jgi:hypothetical protein
LISTLFITLIVEEVVVIVYCTWRRRPLRPLLFTSIFANLITQILLWIVLNVFFRHYLTTLVIAEILIWIMESILLYSIPANRLRFTGALLLSLNMNLASFALGWFLPL